MNSIRPKDRKARATGVAAGIAVENLEGRRLLAATLVADLVTTPASSEPSHLTRMGGALYFFASDAAGRELWKTDGTDAGTVRVKDIYPGPQSSIPTRTDEPDAILAVGDTLFFTASDGASGYELWKSDGTAAGTVRVKDISPAGTSSNPVAFAESNGTLIFTASTLFGPPRVWKSDGTEAGTVPVGPSSAVIDARSARFVTAGDRVYFVATAGGVRKLWATDGTDAGTVPLGGSRPELLTRAGDELFFVDTDAAGDTELWKATETGVERVKDLDAAASSNPASLTAIGDTLYFVAKGRLYKSDGTEAGTAEVVLPAAQPPTVLRVVGAGERAYVFTDSNTTTELWSTDGTEQGTRWVSTVPESPQDAWASDGRLFFTLYQSKFNAFLWTSDGTAAGTVQVHADVPVQPANTSTPSPMPRQKYAPARLEGEWFFTGRDQAGIELWKTDGTPAGTARAADVAGTAGWRSLLPGAALGDEFFFGFDDPARFGENALYKTDGTDGGTVPVRSADGGTFTGVWDTVAAGGAVYFTINTQAVEGFWKTDGSPEGTVELSDFRLVPGLGGATDLSAAGQNVYVDVDNALWRTDGTPAGTVMLREFLALSVKGAALGDTLYFGAGSELWKTDGSKAGTVPVKTFGIMHFTKGYRTDGQF